MESTSQNPGQSRLPDMRLPRSGGSGSHQAMGQTPGNGVYPANGITLCTACHTSINGREKSSKSFLISWWNDQPNRNRPQGKRVAPLLSRMQLITGPMEPVKLLSFNARPHQIEHFRLANSLPA